MDTEKLTMESRVPIGGILCTKRELAFAAILVFGVILLVVAGSLLAVGIGLNDTTNQNRIKIPPEECVTSSCLESSSLLRLLHNASADPCVDFYSYACTGLGKLTSDLLSANQLELTVFHQINVANEERLRNIVEAPDVRKLDWASETKVKKIYKTCRDTYSNTMNGTKRFINNILTPSGGWQALGSFNEATYDLTNAMKKVHIDFYQNALFKIQIGNDWVNRDKHVVEIGLGGLTLNWWEYTYNSERYQQLFDDTRTFIKTVAKLVLRDSGVSMTADDMEQKAQDFANNVFDFEATLANTTWFTLPTENPHDVENRVKVSDLRHANDMVDWADILTTMFREAGVTQNTYVVVLEKMFLSKVNDVIKSLPNQKVTLNNYLTWRLMYGYVVDLGWEYIHANRVFYTARTGLSEFLGVPKYCFNKIRNKFPDAVGALFIRDHLVTEDKAVIDELVTYLKKGLKDRLRAVTWMEDSTRQTAIRKVDLIVDKVGYPSWMAQNDVLDARYSAMQDVSDTDYLHNLIQIAKFELSKVNGMLKNGLDKSEWRINVFDTAYLYDMWWNELLVSAGMLQWPLYGKSFPRYYNFGALGVNLAHELTHSVDEIGGYYLPNGTYFDWWSNKTTQDYNKKRACLENITVTTGPYVPEADSTPKYIDINGTYVAREIAAEMAAIRIAFNGYKDWSAENTAEKLAPGLNLTNEQTFFLAYAQTQCFVRRDSYSIYKAERRIIPEDSRVNLAFAHSPDFVTAFRCPADSPMRAKNMCEVF